MKGYRFVPKDFLDVLLASKKPLSNKNGQLNKYGFPKNTFQKSNSIKCFWFFEDKEEALSALSGLDYDSRKVYLLEFEIPEDVIYEKGQASYSSSWHYEPSESDVKEFTTLKLCPEWLVAGYEIEEEESTTELNIDEDGYLYGGIWFYKAIAFGF